jgi:hypothetical protein
MPIAMTTGLSERINSSGSQALALFGNAFLRLMIPTFVPTTWDGSLRIQANVLEQFSGSAQ